APSQRPRACRAAGGGGGTGGGRGAGTRDPRARAGAVSTDARTRGLWMALAAFVIWGVMPLYWHLLKAVPSLQVVVHRALWSAILVAAFLTLTRGRTWLRAVFS